MTEQIPVESTEDSGVEDGGRPQRPDSPSDLPTEPVASETEAGDEPEADDSGSEAGDDSGGEVLVTKSGKKIRIASIRSIPVAKKRKKVIVRSVTAAIFGGIMLVIIGSIVFAIVMMTSIDPTVNEQDPEMIADMYFVYKPFENPYDIDNPNAAGLPLRGRMMVLVDGSQVGQAYWPAMAEVLGEGLEHSNARGRFDIGVVTGAGVERYNDGMRSLMNADGQAITAFIKGVKPNGEANLANAIKSLEADKPEQIIVITNRNAEAAGGFIELDDALRSMRDTVEAGDGGFFQADILLIDRDDFEWKDLARTFSGEYNSHPLTTIKSWKASRSDSATDDNTETP